jgi:hypothetical protein
MKLRIVALSSALVAATLSGCTIYTQGNQPRNHAPAPPGPRQTQPGQPPNERDPRGVVKFKTRPTNTQPPTTQPPPNQPPPNQPPPASGQGRLIISVVDGSCFITIDGQDQGQKSTLDLNIAPGFHAVGCKPTQGNPQELNVEVKDKHNTAVAFSINDPTKSTYVVTPQGAVVAPPVGRPQGTPPGH